MVQLLQGGTVSQSYSYNAYGYINADEYGIHAPFFGSGGEEQNPFTGLQYLRARYYAPQNGGFITQDSFAGTLANGLSQNRYAYALNNPVNYTDPSGNVPAWMRDKNGDPLKRDPFTTQPDIATTPTKPQPPTSPKKPSEKAADPWMYGTDGKPLQYNPYTTMPDRATVPVVTRTGSKGGYRNPSDTIRQAAGQTSVTTQSIQESSDWVKEMLRNICNADDKSNEN